MTVSGSTVLCCCPRTPAHESAGLPTAFRRVSLNDAPDESLHLPRNAGSEATICAFGLTSSDVAVSAHLGSHGRRSALTIRFSSAGQAPKRDSVDRLAVHPLDEVVGRERPHARAVPGEVGVVE